MLISQNLSFRHPICYSRQPVQQQQKGNNVTFELHNINFPFCHEKCTTIIFSRFKLQNLPGSLSLHDMQMRAQIKQLLSSTRNITTQTKNYRGLLPYLIPLCYVHIYRTTFTPARKPYWIRLLFAHKNSVFWSGR